MASNIRKRDHRLEVRTTAEERSLINQAVEVSRTDLTSFALTALLEASHHVLADRLEFSLTPAQVAEWDRLNAMPARELPGLLRLMERTSPFEFVVVSYLPPRPLEERDDVDNFRSQSNEQTSWLIRHAKQSAASNSTKVFVVTQENERHVVAYYAWTMAHLHLSDSPARLTKGAGRYPQPVALLARLAVDDQHVGYGLGAGLLADVIARFILIGGEIGCRGLLIHAESEEARRFYMHLVPELETSPTDRLHLVLLLKDAQQTLRHRA